MILDTFLAFSWVMPSLIAIAIRYSLPEILGSAASRCFSEMLRLTSLSLNTSRIALARSSLLARISTPFSPDQAMDAPTLRKSNRVLISLAAWLSALSASWRSILDTMSKLDSLGMDHRVDGYGAARHLGHAVVAERSSLRWSRTTAGRSASQPLAMSAILLSAAAAVRRCTAGCPSGQRERSVKPSAQPTLVRTQHLPPCFRRSEPVSSDGGTGFCVPLRAARGPSVGQPWARPD